MNSIHKINAINEREIELAISDDASWHADYKDTAYIYIGNLHQDLKEEDILIIFSQYGNPSHINLVKDKDSGKLRGFCYLKYEDQRSCVLAVDNFNGTKIYERPLRVDHTYYRLMEGQNEDDFKVDYPDAMKEKTQKDMKKEIKLLDYEPESDRDEETNQLSTHEVEVSATAKKAYDDDFEDPMAAMPKLSDSHSKKRRSLDKHRHRSKSKRQKEKDS